MRRTAPLALVAVVATAAACGSSDESLPLACTEGPDEVVAALSAAPEPVTLGDGTPLSKCVDLATTDAELQDLGFALTTAAERLVRQGRALEVGYLVGAARRGARGNAGGVELVRRLENAGRRAGDQAEAERGARAGEAGG